MQVEKYDSPWKKQTELWVRDPGRNVDVCFDFGMTDFVFTQRTNQFKRNMSFAPEKVLGIYARGRPWRAMLVEYDAEVTLLFDHRRGFDKVLAVYPSWSFREDSFERLWSLTQTYPRPGQKVGRFRYRDSIIHKIKDDQEKVIIVRGQPRDRLDWHMMINQITEMKRYRPDVKFHFHGGKSTARTVGVSVDSVDHPITLEWRDGDPLFLCPNGQAFDPLKTKDLDHWAKLIGESLWEYRRLDERFDRSRYNYRFNLKSIRWLQRNQDKLYDFNRPKPDAVVDYESSDETWVPHLTNYRPKISEPNDRWLCDTCTINARCPYSRVGAICIVDGTEAHKLSEQFNSRKASDIIDGLSTLLSANTVRLETALDSEKEVAAQTGVYRLSPQLSTLMNSVFDRGIQMARLLDPNVAGQMSNSRVNVGIVNGNAGAVAASTPQELMAGAAHILTEKYGIPLEDVTQDQLEAVLNGDEPKVHRKVIDVQSDDDS